MTMATFMTSVRGAVVCGAFPALYLLRFISQLCLSCVINSIIETRSSDPVRLLTVKSNKHSGIVPVKQVALMSLLTLRFPSDEMPYGDFMTPK